MYIKNDDLEEFSKLMLNVNELKMELGRLVQSLTMQARKGIDSENEYLSD